MRTLRKYSQHPDNAGPTRRIRPARYDVSAINNLANVSTINGSYGYTDRQQALAVKLITKYKKQWRSLGYDVSNISLETPTEREIRTHVDRHRTVDFDGENVIVFFPYMPKLIGEFYQQLEHYSAGSFEFIKSKKQWKIYPSPDNAKWIQRIAKEQKFELTEKFLELVETINNSYDYNDIKLDMVEGDLVLLNAPESLQEWIAENIGEVAMHNLLPLAMNANRSAYTISKSVKTLLEINYPHLLEILLQSETLIIPDSKFDIARVIADTREQNIVFYTMESGAMYDEDAGFIRARFPNYNIWLDDHIGGMDPTRKNIFITKKVIPIIPDVIVSFVGFMTGPTRKMWFNLAKKKIYYCNDVDKKIKKAIKKNESNSCYKG